MICLLDTDIVIFILRGNEKLKMELDQAFFEGGDVCISVITYYEVKRKILQVYGSPSKQLQSFEKFIKPVTILPFNQQTADIASKLNADLKAKGKPISSCDILIGATAIEKGLPVVADDKHFSFIDGIKRGKWNM